MIEPIERQRDEAVDKTVDNVRYVEPISEDQHGVAEAVARQLLKPVKPVKPVDK